MPPRCRSWASRAIAVDGIDCLVSRSGYTGEDGFEISVPPDSAETLADTLLAQPEVVPVGLGARDSLRLEAGLCLYGNDIDELTTPDRGRPDLGHRQAPQAGLGFPGRPVMRDQLDNGPPRRRVGIRPDGRAPARAQTDIVAGRRHRGGRHHLRRLRADAERADRHGLCPQRPRRRRHQPVLIVRGKTIAGHASCRCPSSPTATSAERNAPMASKSCGQALHQGTRMGACWTATSPPSASPTTRRSNSATWCSVELPELERDVADGEACAVVESVKAASDVYRAAGRQGRGDQRNDHRGPVDREQRRRRRGLVLPPGTRRHRRVRGADGSGRLRRIPGDVVSMDRPAPESGRAASGNDGFVRRHIGPSETEIAAMLHVIGARDAGRCRRQDGAGGDPLQSGAGPAAADRRGGGDRRTARPGGRNVTTKVADRHGLSRHRHAAGDPAQRAGKSRLVHRLHAVPGGDRAGPAGGAAELPDA